MCLTWIPGRRLWKAERSVGGCMSKLGRAAIFRGETGVLKGRK